MQRTEENTKESDHPFADIADIFDLYILDQSLFDRHVDFAAPFGPFYLTGSWRPTDIPTGTLTDIPTGTLTGTLTATPTSHQQTAADSVLYMPFDDTRAAVYPTRSLVIYRFSANTVIYLYFGDPHTTDRKEICRMSNEMFDAYARAYVDAAYIIYERMHREWDTQPEWDIQPEWDTQPELNQPELNQPELNQPELNTQ